MRSMVPLMLISCFSDSVMNDTKTGNCKKSSIHLPKMNDFSSDSLYDDKM